MPTLGKHGPEVSSLALGCMAMSGMYGASSDDASVATIHAAIDRGINLLDTGDFYGAGHNELLLRRALAGRRHQVLLSVKFGVLRGPDGGWNGIDNRPVALKNYLTYSLTRLGVDHVDIYRPARLDPSVPIEDTIGALGDLVRAGYVRYLGLSEVSAATIRRAHAIHPIADVQLEHSLISRDGEAEIFPTLDELGISATLYGVLSRGLLSGSEPQAGDFRAHLPRFAGQALERNRGAVAQLAAFAAARGMTASQAAIAWVRATRPNDVPLIGARTEAQLEDALGALAHPLSPAEAAELGAVMGPAAIAGERYPAPQLAHIARS